MNCCICEGHFRHVFLGGGGALLCLIFVPLLFWVCMPNVICSFPWLVQCTIRILRVVPMMLYHLAYFGLILFSLVGLEACGCSQIIQICACRLIGGDEFLIAWADLYWLLTAVLIFLTIGYVSLYLCCIFPLWNYFWTPGWLSLHCLPCDNLGEPTVTRCSWL